MKSLIVLTISIFLLAFCVIAAIVGSTLIIIDEIPEAYYVLVFAMACGLSSALLILFGFDEHDTP